MTLTFYVRVAKGLQIKVKKFSGIISTSVGVTGENWYRGLFPRQILNRVKSSFWKKVFNFALFCYSISLFKKLTDWRPATLLK